MDKEGDRDKVEGYIKGVEEIISRVGGLELPSKVKEVIDLANAYVNDARYYLEKGDVFTSLACVAYAEGLLDSLRFQGLVDFKWPKQPLRKTVLVGGVFDIIHPGHLFFLKKAWDMGRVIVVVARDTTVLRFKGRKPVFPERYRKQLLESIKYVYKVVLGEPGFNPVKVIKEIKPDIILLGPDQEKIGRSIRETLEKETLGKNIKVVVLNEVLKGELFRSSSIIAHIKSDPKARGQSVYTQDEQDG
ncbi:MAG: cytidylyltransferase family protein [Thermoproteales archaeon]|nr:cytidylyltransferase family protein [Thermoproteales archaeon]